MADSKMFAKSGGEWIPVYPDPNRGAAPILSAAPDATQIVYTWTAAAGLTVASYEFEFDGVIENVGNVLTVTKTGLTTGSSHTARVRAKSDENVRGPWSNLLTTIAEVPYNEATGGTVTDVPDYNGTGETWRIHTFADSGTLSVTKGSQPFRALVVAGGGGGGSSGGGQDRNGQWYGGGGGGAGGLLSSDSLTIPTGDIAITVGGGGGGASGGSPGGVGGNSSIAALLVASGGGYGAYSWPGPVGGGSSGGSGGGAGFYENSQPLGGGEGIAGQGNAGGGIAPTGEYYRTMAGGGGGAGGAGSPNVAGPGLSVSITGAAVVYAQGGMGGNSTPGGGGGHGGYRAAPDAGGGAAGNKGIVIVAYRIG